jgi:hypothetical protein
MPRGKHRTPDQILADLEAAKEAELAASRKRLRELEEQIQKTKPKVSEARKREQAAEQFAAGRLVISLLDSDTSLKRRLVDAACKLDQKDRDRVALERLLGKLSVPSSASPATEIPAEADAA